MNQDEAHDFALLQHTGVEPSAVIFDEGHWEEFSSSDHRKAQVEADSISYIWDHLIEDLSKHVIQGTHYFRTGCHVSEAEELLRWLAREPRLRRRVLVKALTGLIKSAPNNQRATRYIVPLEASDPYYVFLTLPMSIGKDHDDYRALRRELMGVCALALRSRWANARHVVGIATEPGLDNGGRSHDAMYIDLTSIDESRINKAIRTAARLGILVRPRARGFSEQEYPSPPSARKDDASPSRPVHSPGGLMEPIDASLQRGR